MRFRRRQRGLVLTKEERDALAQRPYQANGDHRTVFDLLVCNYCGGLHAARCPRVKAVELAADGKTPTRIEFFPWGEWPDHLVLWPDTPTQLPPEQEGTP